jgi:hypothetical protein|tara:strand:+ start:63 stop:467 length:405 start_codon:yes stop_codon:yes gene_type:complete
MVIRKLNESDYEEILIKWWKDWRWEPPAIDFLPDNGKGGFIVYDGDTPVCAGFNYLTNSKVGWCDFVISNFKYKDREKRKEAITLLISTIDKVLELSECKYVFTSVKNKQLINTYKELGYTEGSSNCSEMIKKL